VRAVRGMMAQRYINTIPGSVNHGDAELSMGWVDPRVGLGWVGLGRDF